MREVTTLKQLMLDAARYRWLRDNFIVVDWMSLCDTRGSDELDELIDAELDRE